MGLLKKPLKKWREPKVPGTVTGKNIFVAIILVIVISVPFGYLGGHGFDISIWLIALAFLAAAPLSLALAPLSPGTPVELGEDGIIRGSRQPQMSAYGDINRVYFSRNCTWARKPYLQISNYREGNSNGPRFTNFVAINRAGTSGSVSWFVVPEKVDLNEILQIFRSKNIEVIETPLDKLLQQNDLSGNLGPH